VLARKGQEQVAQFLLRFDRLARKTAFCTTSPPTKTGCAPLAAAPQSVPSALHPDNAPATGRRRHPTRI